MLKRVFTSVFLCVFVCSYGLGATPVAVTGQVLAHQVQVDGIGVPSGTTLLNQSVVRTAGSYPAFIHLQNGHLVELHRNSEALVEESESGIQVTMKSGTMSYASTSGLATALPSSSVTFSSGVYPVAQETGMRVVLAAPAEAGATVIRVNDATRVAPDMAIMLRSPDGTIQEIHYIDSYREHEITLTAPLQQSFPANTVITQNPEQLKAAIDAGAAAVVGVGAGVSAGAAAAGSAAAAGAGAAAGAAAAGAGAAAGIGAGAAAGIAAGAAAAGLGIAAGAGAFDEDSPS